MKKDRATQGISLDPNLPVRFECSVFCPEGYSYAGGVEKREPAKRAVIQVTIDMEYLINHLGRRAVGSKRKKTSLSYGMVEVVVISEREVQ
jgi:hypothetical protein